MPGAFQAWQAGQLDSSTLESNLLSLHSTCTESQKFHEGITFLLQREKAEREQLQEDIKKLESTVRALGPRAAQGVPARSKVDPRFAATDEKVWTESEVDARVENALVKWLGSSPTALTNIRRLSTLATDAERLQEQVSHAVKLEASLADSLNRLQSQVDEATTAMTESRERGKGDARAAATASDTAWANADEELPAHLKRLKKVHDAQAKMGSDLSLRWVTSH